ncbi:MAG: PRC-barrel domain-containing protein [Rhodospirillales bacterium]|nr:PRC-barrel domain-containing protein [Rhodospirillales bacterium]
MAAVLSASPSARLLAGDAAGDVKPPPVSRPSAPAVSPSAPPSETSPGAGASEEPPSASPSREAGDDRGGKISLLPSLQPIPPDEAIGVLGKKVRGPADEDMGMVVDVLVDAEAHPRAAVIDFGGFLGVGSRKIAVHWQALNFRPTDRAAPVLLKLGRAEVQAAPEYKPTSQPPEVVIPPATVAPALQPPADKPEDKRDPPPPPPPPPAAPAPPGPATESPRSPAPAPPRPLPDAGR